MKPSSSLGKGGMSVLLERADQGRPILFCNAFEMLNVPPRSKSSSHPGRTKFGRKNLRTTFQSSFIRILPFCKGAENPIQNLA